MTMMEMICNSDDDGDYEPDLDPDAADKGLNPNPNTVAEGE
jgi:hypothetical protein